MTLKEYITKEKGMTMTYISDKLDISYPATLYKIENISSISLEEGIELARLLNISVEEIIKFKEV